MDKKLCPAIFHSYNDLNHIIECNDYRHDLLPNLDRFQIDINTRFKIEIVEIISPVLFSARIIEITYLFHQNNEMIERTINYAAEEFNDFHLSIQKYYMKEFVPCEKILIDSTYILKDETGFYRCTILAKV